MTVKKAARKKTAAPTEGAAPQAPDRMQKSIDKVMQEQSFTGQERKEMQELVEASMKKIIVQEQEKIATILKDMLDVRDAQQFKPDLFNYYAAHAPCRQIWQFVTETEDPKLSDYPDRDAWQAAYERHKAQHWPFEWATKMLAIRRKFLPPTSEELSLYDYYAVHAPGRMLWQFVSIRFNEENTAEENQLMQWPFEWARTMVDKSSQVQYGVTMY